MDRYAFLIALSHNARALLFYDLAWTVLLLAATVFALHLRRAARQIDRRIRWERDCEQQEVVYHESCAELAGGSPVTVMAKQPCSWWAAVGETQTSKPHDKVT